MDKSKRLFIFKFFFKFKKKLIIFPDGKKKKIAAAEMILPNKMGREN